MTTIQDAYNQTFFLALSRFSVRFSRLRKACHKLAHNASTTLQPGAIAYATATTAVQVKAVAVTLIAISASIVAIGIYVAASSSIATIDDDGRARWLCAGKRLRGSGRSCRRLLPARAGRFIIIAGRGRMTLALRRARRHHHQQHQPAIPGPRSPCAQSGRQFGLGIHGNLLSQARLPGAAQLQPADCNGFSQAALRLSIRATSAVRTLSAWNAQQ